MKKLNIFLVVAFIALMIYNISISRIIDKLSYSSNLLLENIEALTFNESSGDFPCSSGGPGSTSCSTSISVGNIVGFACSVECDKGYYACCNTLENKCQCRKNNS